MASFTTPLEMYSSNGDSVTYILNDHTAQKPSLVIQSRKVANSASGNIETRVAVVRGTLDSEGALIPSRAMIDISGKYPKHGDFADVQACLATAIDLISSDEFLEALQKQTRLQP